MVVFGDKQRLAIVFSREYEQFLPDYKFVDVFVYINGSKFGSKTKKRYMPVSVWHAYTVFKDAVFGDIYHSDLPPAKLIRELNTIVYGPDRDEGESNRQARLSNISIQLNSFDRDILYICKTSESKYMFLAARKCGIQPVYKNMISSTLSSIEVEIDYVYNIIKECNEYYSFE